MIRQFTPRVTPLRQRTPRYSILAAAGRKGRNAQSSRQLSVLLFPSTLLLLASLVVRESGPARASAGYDLRVTPALIACATGETVSYLDSCGCRAKQRGGLARRDTIRERFAANHEYVLLVDNGDLIEKSARLDLVKADTLIGAMNAMGYSAMAVGDQEAALGVSRLRSLQEKAAFPFLCANLFEGSEASLLFAPHTIKRFQIEEHELRVGIVALLGKEFESTVRTHMKDASIGSPIECLEKALSDLEGQADVIVLLYHASRDAAIRLAWRFPSVNVIVAGHDTTVPQVTKMHDRDQVVVGYGTRGAYVAAVPIQLSESGKWATGEPKLIPLTEDILDSPAMIELIKRTFYSAFL